VFNNNHSFSLVVFEILTGKLFKVKFKAVSATSACHRETLTGEFDLIPAWTNFLF